MTGATLTFSDGSTVTVPALDNDGAATTVDLPRPQHDVGLRITVTGVSGSTSNVGLSEVQAWGTGPVTGRRRRSRRGSNVAGVGDRRRRRRENLSRRADRGQGRSTV